MTTIRFPIRPWLGKYEATLLRLYGSRTFYMNDFYLEKFFSHFPNTVGLEEFTIADITDYRAWRESDGAKTQAVANEISALNRFWKWLIEKNKLHLSNPTIKIKSSTSARYERQFKLEDFRRLLDACSDKMVREHLVDLAGGYDRSNEFGTYQLGVAIHNAGVLADMPWLNLVTLRSAIKQSLWRDIIKREYQKLRDSLTPEPQPASDTLANI